MDTRVVILDDNDVVRAGLRYLFESEPDISVAGEAATAEQALSLVSVLRPDIAVVDIGLPESNGIAVAREIADHVPHVTSVVLTCLPDELAELSAALAGAAAYSVKQIRGVDLIGIVRGVMQGNAMFSPETRRRTIDHCRRAYESDPLRVPFSRSEGDVLTLISEGRTDRDIASTLSMEEADVRGHVASICAKFGLNRSARMESVA